jgi:hypothetical protein
MAFTKRLLVVANPDDAGGGQMKGAFVTGASLTSFPVAAGAVKLIWEVLQTTLGSWADGRWVVLIISGFVGLALILFGLANSKPRLDATATALAVAIGIINSFFLAAAVLGLDVVLNPPT